MNSQSNKLAIVIPAYKVDFLSTTINSIVNQTCQDFNLYICDDNSPYGIKEVVDSYVDDFEITYVKFPNNLGQKNLVAHWERCINQINNEEWIWFFSDDDVMERNCVEEFYEYLKINSETDLFRFKMLKIDEVGNELDYVGKDNIFNSIEELIKGRLLSTIQIAVVEFIFKKRKFLEVGGFEYFDLAWGSDDATWIKIAKDKGVVNISTASVYWRISTQNISAIVTNEVSYRKMKARIAFSKWLIQLHFSGNVKINTTDLLSLVYNWVHRFLKGSINELSVSQIIEVEYGINKILNISYYYKNVRVCKVLFFKLLNSLKKKIKTIVRK